VCRLCCLRGFQVFSVSCFICLKGFCLVVKSASLCGALRRVHRQGLSYHLRDYCETAVVLALS
jgi:hypothetical protein